MLNWTSNPEPFSMNKKKMHVLSKIWWSPSPVICQYRDLSFNSLLLTGGIFDGLSFVTDLWVSDISLKQGKINYFLPQTSYFQPRSHDCVYAHAPDHRTPMTSMICNLAIAMIHHCKLTLTITSSHQMTFLRNLTRCQISVIPPQAFRGLFSLETL